MSSNLHCFHCEVPYHSDPDIACITPTNTKGRIYIIFLADSRKHTLSSFRWLLLPLCLRVDLGKRQDFRAGFCCPDSWNLSTKQNTLKPQSSQLNTGPLRNSAQSIFPLKGNRSSWLLISAMQPRRVSQILLYNDPILGKI